MKKIIIDTNALMAIAEFKLDIFAALQEACDFPYQLFVLEETLHELEKIKEEQRGKYKEAAQLALLIIMKRMMKKKIIIMNKQGAVDELLVEHSQKGDLILTQDRELKKRLTKPYLTIRQRKKIMLVE
jgi:rRNA-processing protein FCF1